MTRVLPEFKSFDSIPRLKRDCIITEKLDGTNAQVYIPEDLSFVQAGSRNRWITPEHDNYGFGAWVAEHEEELKKLGPGQNFGEWWGSGIQRRYDLNEKRFSLFNSSRWSDDAVRPSCCHVVPVLYTGPFSTEVVDETLGCLKARGSVASPGFMDPEGIVVYLQAARRLFKVTLGGDGHKGTRNTP